MNLKMYNQEGKEVGEKELSKVFDVPMNRDLMHQVVTSQEANERRVVAHAKGRGEVRGGGRKPWRQKGTGRARHGSIRSPLWKGGGVTHGPTKERVFAKKINKKMAAKALAMAVSAKAKDGELILLDGLKLVEGKTKEAATILANLAKQKPFFALTRKSVAVLLPDGSVTEVRAFRNLANVVVEAASHVTARDFLTYAYLVMPQEVISVLEKRVAK